MPSCDPVQGWGVGWGGGWGIPVPAGPNIPNEAPYDVYCVCGASTTVLDTYTEVVLGPGTNFTATLSENSFTIFSDALPGTDEAELFVDLSVPDPAFTLEGTFRFDVLPVNFADVPNIHSFLGLFNAGGSVGLFFSQVGIGYGYLNGPFQVLPGTAGLIQENKIYTLRVAVDLTPGQQVVYLYFTSIEALALNGHKLIAQIGHVDNATIIPAPTTEGTLLHLKGDEIKTTIFELCLGTGLVIPNFAPIAVPGEDRTGLICEVIKLDGSGSYDPEDQLITYKWRLIGCPLDSQYSHDFQDGQTFAGVGGFTDKLYSTGFGFLGPTPLPIVPNSTVLVIGGTPYTIIFSGTDGGGDYVQIALAQLPELMSGLVFYILDQNGFNGPLQAITTFFPDKMGFYKFDLVVHDGVNYSLAVPLVVNVVESPLPAGCYPDLNFIWSYLSDFWRLLEDRERITTYWSGVAQIMATLMYDLWQTEYGKSIRDIQRTTNRRWLAYDLLLREPYPELTTLRSVWEPIISLPVLNVGESFNAQVLVLSIPYYDDLVVVTVTLANPVSPKQLADFLETQLKDIDSRFSVKLVPNTPTTTVLAIRAPFSVTVVAGTTLTPFTVGQASTIAANNLGIGATVPTPTVFKLGAGSFRGYDLREDDLFYIRDASLKFHVARVKGTSTAPGDPETEQRLLLKDELPLTPVGSWGFCLSARSTQLDFYNGLVGVEDWAVIEVVDQTQQAVAHFTTTVLGVVGSLRNIVGLAPDALMLPFFSSTSRFSAALWGVYRREHIPIEPLIVDIPLLQRKIRDPDEDDLLHKNVDFELSAFRGKKCIKINREIYPIVDFELFSNLPRLWAEYTYLDNRPSIEGTFGLLAGLPLEKSPASIDYLSAVKGLLYALTHGPTVRNIRIGIQILLGLPFAEEDSTVLEIRDDLSPTTSRILLTETATGTVRDFTYPKILGLETNPATKKVYAVGDAVKQFSPLVRGIEVLDWVGNPDELKKYFRAGFSEVEKVHKFLVKAAARAYNADYFSLVKSFLYEIKPTYTLPVFMVSEEIGPDDIDVDDEIRFALNLFLQDGVPFKPLYHPIDTGPPHPVPLLLSNLGSSPAFDDWDASPGFKAVAGDSGPVAPNPLSEGHSTPAFDIDPNQSDIFGYGSFHVPWAFDRPYMNPEQFPSITLRTDFLVPTVPDGNPVFITTIPAYDSELLLFGQLFLMHIPELGTVLLESVTSAPSTISVNQVFLQFKCPSSTEVTDFKLKIWVNGVLVFDEAFTQSFPDYVQSWSDVTGPPGLFTPPIVLPLTSGPFTVNAGEPVTVALFSDEGVDLRRFITGIMVSMGHAIPHVVGTPVAAGTYRLPRLA